MEHTEHARKTRPKEVVSKIAKKTQKKQLFIGGVILVILIFIVWTFSGSKSSRTETYKKASGAAGLNASIAYDCKEQCYNFNIYVMRDDGQQVAVVRPDKDGKVNLAMPEGDYVMLIGKQFGKDKLFPQEPILLKNGQELELKLRYKEGTL